jgi:hypothetical protein
MSIQSTALRADYTGNGLTRVFVVPFYFIEADHVKILRTDNVTSSVTVLNLDTDYTLDGVGSVYGGAATLGTAPTFTQKITILRNIPYEQLTHYVENDPFPAASHEFALDKIVMQIQQLAEIVSRCVKVKDSETCNVTLPSVADRAGKFLTFDSSGNVQTSVNAVPSSTLSYGRTIATPGQTVFPTPVYLPGSDNLIVVCGGQMLTKGYDYTETNFATITLTQAASSGDVVVFRVLR